MKKDMSREETITVLETMMITTGTCRTEKEALERAIKDIKKVKKMKIRPTLAIRKLNKFSIKP